MGYQYQDNEEEVILRVRDSPEINISCILSKPESSNCPDTPRAAILVHGFGSHKNAVFLSKLARKLSKEQGVYTMRIDFINCGDSTKTGENGRTLQDDIGCINVVYKYLSTGGVHGKRLFVDALVGHSRGVVDIFNWQLQHPEIYVPNLVACAGRFIGRGLLDSILANNPDYEEKGGRFISGFQDGAYRPVWVPYKEDESLFTLEMDTVKHVNKDTSTLLVYGTRENVIPLEDAARYNNTLAGRNTLKLIPGADHCFLGTEKLSPEQRRLGKLPVHKSGVVDYNFHVADEISEWLEVANVHKRFLEKARMVHPYLSRWHDVPGLSNFRDIGGYAVSNSNAYLQYSKIYRCDDLTGVSLGTVAHLKRLEIAKVYDCSSCGTRDPGSLLQENNIDYVCRANRTPDEMHALIYKQIRDHPMDPLVIINDSELILSLMVVAGVDPLLVAQEALLYSSSSFRGVTLGTAYTCVLNAIANLSLDNVCTRVGFTCNDINTLRDNLVTKFPKEAI